MYLQLVTFSNATLCSSFLNICSQCLNPSLNITFWAGTWNLVDITRPSSNQTMQDIVSCCLVVLVDISIFGTLLKQVRFSVLCQLVLCSALLLKILVLLLVRLIEYAKINDFQGMYELPVFPQILFQLHFMVLAMSLFLCKKQKVQQNYPSSLGRNALMLCFS